MKKWIKRLFILGIIAGICAIVYKYLQENQDNWDEDDSDFSNDDFDLDDSLDDASREYVSLNKPNKNASSETTAQTVDKTAVSDSISGSTSSFSSSINNPN